MSSVSTILSSGSFCIKTAKKGVISDFYGPKNAKQRHLDKKSGDQKEKLNSNENGEVKEEESDSNISEEKEMLVPIPP